MERYADHRFRGEVGAEMPKPKTSDEGAQRLARPLLLLVRLSEPLLENLSLLADAETREDQIQNVVAGGLAGKRIELTQRPV